MVFILATHCTAEFPSRVRALVLIAPADMLLMPSPRGDLFSQIGRRLPDSKRGSFDAWRKRQLDFSGIPGKSERELVAEQDEMCGFYKTRPP